MRLWQTPACKYNYCGSGSLAPPASQSRLALTVPSAETLRKAMNVMNAMNSTASCCLCSMKS